MNALLLALLPLLMSDPAPTRSHACPCVEGATGNDACSFSDPRPELRMRLHMEGSLSKRGRRTWRGPTRPEFVPLTDGELSLQLLDVTPDGYFALWRSLYVPGESRGQNPRYRARLYHCDGKVAWTIDLDKLFPRPDQLEIQDARYSGGVLYFNEACQSYAKYAKGRCSYLVALDPRQQKALWQTGPLVSNGRFFITPHYLIAIYAFTAEQRRISAVDRRSGAVVAKAKLRGHFERAKLVGEELQIRTEEGDEHFGLAGLLAGKLKAIAPRPGPPTLADAGRIPKTEKPLTCKPARPTPTLTPVAENRNDVAFSADGRMRVLYFAKEATLITPAHPEGITFTEVAHIDEVVFAPDGKQVAFVLPNRGISVRSTQDGRVLRLIDQPRSDLGQRMLAYGVQFREPEQLYFVGGCQQPQARLFAVSLASAAPARPVGGSFRCQNAWATPDGRTWLFADERKPGAIHRLDPATGAITALVQGTVEEPLSEVSVSPGLDWVCYDRKSRHSLLFCQNVADGRLLNLGERYRFTGFAETGARMVIGGGERNRDTGKERERMFLVDLDAGTWKELFGAPYRNSGGFAILFGDGRVLATPSGAALRLCDLATGAAYTVRERRMFGLFSVPGETAAIVSREHPDGRHADLFELKLPAKGR